MFWLCLISMLSLLLPTFQLGFHPIEGSILESPNDYLFLNHSPAYYNKYAQGCNPTFLHYPNLDRVLTPEPIFESFGPPNGVIDRLLNLSRQCWHPDQAHRHPGLGEHEAQNVWAIYELAAAIMKASNDPDLVAGDVPSSDHIVPIDGYAIKSSASTACRLFDGLKARLFSALPSHGQSPSIDEDSQPPMSEPCTLQGALIRWSFFLANRPPSVHPFWFTEEAFEEPWWQSPLTHLVRFYGLDFDRRNLLESPAKEEATKAEKENWIRQGWFTVDHFSPDDLDLIDMREEHETRLDEEDFQWWMAMELNALKEQEEEYLSGQSFCQHTVPHKSTSRTEDDWRRGWKEKKEAMEREQERARRRGF